MKKFTHKGQWWLPGKDKKLTGTLEFDPATGGKLEVFGNFHDTLAIDDESYSLPIVYGETANGEDLTLLNVIYKSRSFGAGVQLAQLIVHHIVEGVLLETPDEKTFDSIYANLFHLDEWVNLPIYFYENENNPREIVVRRKVPPLPDAIEINSNLKAKITIGWNGPSWDIVQNRVEMTRKTSIQFAATTLESYDYLSSSVHTFEIFLSLLTGERSAPLGYTCHIPGAQVQRQHGLETPVYFAPRAWWVTQNKPNLPPYMRLTYQRIKDELPDRLRAWFNNHQKLKPVYDLYYAQRHDKSAIASNRFLNMTQAAESFHQRFVHASRKNFLPRLEELFAIVPDVLQPLFTKQGGPTAFATSVRDTRNYFTHYGEKSVKRAVTDGAQLLWMTEKLRFVLEVWLLRSVGFSDDTIKEGFANDREYKFICGK